MKKYLLIVSMLAVAACAKKPEQISAVEVGDKAYHGYSCRQLKEEKLQISQDLENLSASQRSAANGDAWGVFLLGLPLSSMSGNDKEAAIAIAKGRVQAIDRESERKGC